MNDSISRQAAIDVLEERIQANGYSNAALVSEFNRSIGYLMRLPSAEVEPVKHGRWEPVTNGRGGFECSICHNYAPSYQDGVEWLSLYCPHCGAKMNTEEGETHEIDRC